MIIQPRYYQEEAVDATFDYLQNNKGNPLIAAPTGCHAKDTGILMYDGTVKLVQDVKVWDKLMGPDGEPRTVWRLIRGREAMRRIVPTKGEPFVVNKSHKLSLKRVRQKSNDYFDCNKAAVETVIVEDYEKGTKWFKHIRKLRRVGVDFPTKQQKLDPYFLGFMLGDGSLAHGAVTFSSLDLEPVNYIKKYAESRECNTKTRDGKNYRITSPVWQFNPILNDFRSLGLFGSRSSTVFVPQEYKTGDRQQRLAILAGLIDADGHLCENGTYDYISISKQLAYDVVYLARSLGLAAYCARKDARLYGRFISDAWRVCISGDLSAVPCLLPRKQAKPRLQIKDVLCTGFTVEQLPEDDFYGFTLDKDHLYLTEDFTVHHNSGKSLIIAGIIWQIFFKLMWANCRIIVATHDKKLIENNYNTLKRMWPTAPAGIVSAGLKRKDFNTQIIFGGIKSLVGKLLNADSSPQWVDLLIVDEAHLISNKDQGQYVEFILSCISANPNMRVVGLTATWYRLGQGLLTDGSIFHDICYNICDVAGFARLLREKFLAPLITPSEPRSKVSIDLSTVGFGSDGDYREGALQKEIDRPEVNYAAMREACAHGINRQSWMVFAAGVEHVEHLQQMLSGGFGVPCVGVHSKMKPKDVDEAFRAFKAGEVRAIINKGMATTGFDHPPVDMIVDLGATVSAALHVQKNGRGTRPYDARNPQQYIPGFNYTKTDCLVLDFVGNIERCGPINDPVIPKKPGTGKGGGVAPIKICEPKSLIAPQQGCGNYQHTSVKYCTVCGAEFNTASKLTDIASTAEIIRSEEPEQVIEVIDVDRVTYSRFVTSKMKKELREEGRSWTPADNYMIKATYYCGLRNFNEFVTLEAPHGTQAENYQRKLGRDWFKLRFDGDPPLTNDEVLELNSYLKQPRTIEVWTNKKPYPSILKANFI